MDFFSTTRLPHCQLWAIINWDSLIYPLLINELCYQSLTTTDDWEPCNKIGSPILIKKLYQENYIKKEFLRKWLLKCTEICANIVLLLLTKQILVPVHAVAVHHHYCFYWFGNYFPTYDHKNFPNSTFLSWDWRLSHK